MNIEAVSLEDVRTHILCLIEAKTNIFPYALLNMYARDV